MMRVLCLRLSLTFNHTTLDHVLPGCVCCDETFLEQAVDRSFCDWIEVEKLTEEEVKKQCKHGTMVHSKLPNEGAVEGFWHLIINEKPFVLFLQMDVVLEAHVMINFATLKACDYMIHFCTEKIKDKTERKTCETANATRFVMQRGNTQTLKSAF